MYQTRPVPTPIRKRLHRREGTALRFLTFSCYNRLPLFTKDAIKALFVAQVDLTRARLGFGVVAWVIMPDHVHLLIDPRGVTMARILMSLKRPFAARVLARWRDLNAAVLSRITDSQGEAHFWQPGGGYDRSEYTPKEISEKIAYIHENPVRRGLVGEATDWAWSSARAWAGWRDQPIPIVRSGGQD